MALLTPASRASDLAAMMASPSIASTSLNLPSELTQEVDPSSPLISNQIDKNALVVRLLVSGKRASNVKTLAAHPSGIPYTMDRNTMKHGLFMMHHDVDEALRSSWSWKALDSPSPAQVQDFINHSQDIGDTRWKRYVNNIVKVEFLIMGDIDKDSAEELFRLEMTGDAVIGETLAKLSKAKDTWRKELITQGVLPACIDILLRHHAAYYATNFSSFTTRRAFWRTCLVGNDNLIVFAFKYVANVVDFSWIFHSTPANADDLNLQTSMQEWFREKMAILLDLVYMGYLDCMQNAGLMGANGSWVTKALKYTYTSSHNAYFLRPLGDWPTKDFF